MSRKPKENRLFPGRENYIGPNDGFFSMLHHEGLVEHTYDYPGGVSARVDYVKCNKDDREIKVRLRNMISLADMPGIQPLDLLLQARRALVGSSNPKAESLRYNIRGTIANILCDPTFQKRVLAYVNTVYPANAWDGSGIRGTAGHRFGIKRRKRK